jgi:hypothetical protein
MAAEYKEGERSADLPALMMTMMQSKVNIVCKGAIVNERSLQVEIRLLRWDGATKVGWGKKGRNAAFF